MSESFLSAATVRSKDAGVAAPENRSGSFGLIFDAEFWQKEHGAPLLKRNAKFLPTQEVPDELRQRLAAWPVLCGADSEEEVVEGVCDDEAALRIFLRDAERTFKDETHRSRMIELLKRVWPENRDYHQGLGYVTSLFMLFFDDETTVRMLLQLTRKERYTPGYWRAAPEPYVRDAMVYARLVEERLPEVASLLKAACVVPESYASKWLIGLNVHVLPFASLVTFVEAFLERGHIFLFQFSLALVQKVSTRLLALAPTDVNVIYELLRLDETAFPNESEEELAFFAELVEEAKAVSLEPEQIASLREEEAAILEAKMVKAREREAALAAESDDEIVFSDEED